MRSRRRLAIATSTLLVGAHLMIASAEAASAVTVNSGPGPVNTGSRAEVAAAYQQVLVPALQVPGTWDGSVDTCDPGSGDPDGESATLQAVNWARAMAGEEPAALDAQLNSRALATALIMDANDTLTHDPTTDMACFSEEGRVGAGSSNLARGFDDARAIDAYLRDGGGSNTAAGHRRWILNPGSSLFGAGSTDGYQALTVFARDVDTTTNPGTPEWIPWPTAGYFPYEQEPRGRWSFSTTRNVDLDTASVVVEASDGHRLDLVVHAAAYGYGPDTVVWDLAEPLPEPLADETYTVTVSGMVEMLSDGTRRPLPSYSYPVTLFSAADADTTGAGEEPAARPEPTPVWGAYEPSGSIAVGGTPRVGSTLRVLDDLVWEQQPDTLAYTWQREGVVLARGPRYTPAPADLGTTLTLVVRATSGDRVWTRSLTTGAVRRGPANTVVRAPVLGGTAYPGTRVRIERFAVWQRQPGPDARTRWAWLVGGRVAQRNGRAYQVRRRDLGKVVRLKLVLTDPGYVRSVAWSNRIRVRARR